MTASAFDPDDRWPSLPFRDWEATCDTLHLWTQIVGKVKVRMSPFLNELWHVALYPTPRGLTTGRIPYARGAFAMRFDFVDHQLSITTSQGDRSTIALYPRSVADFYTEFTATLPLLGIDVAISTRPDEIPDPIPFPEDRVHAAYDATWVRRWWTVSLQVAEVLDRFRSSFVGKSSPVLMWWGSFDLSTTRYSGRPAPLLEGAPRFMQLAEDQENFTCGFWPGNITAGGVRPDEPLFFAYAYPEPRGIRDAAIGPVGARWDGEMGLFALPYQQVRTAAAPAADVLRFFEEAYGVAAQLAQWDPNLRQTPPHTR